MLSQNSAIGGYFELELPARNKEKYPGSLKYQSARAAFLALLESIPDTCRVWMPNYMCDTMLSPVRLAGKEIKFYSIDISLAPVKKIPLKNGDILFYVNYFGLCNRNVQNLLEKYDAEKVVIDCSQAFFSEPYDCLATIYSPRKFFGIPDGGILCTRQVISLPSEQDEGSFSRANHLLQRLAFSAEQGYESYKLAEESLKDMTPKRMSKFTNTLLSSIDHESAKIKRRENFKTLHENLGADNILKWEFDSAAAPMCYPFLPKKRIIKQRLIEKRIFLPTYWPEVKERENLCSFEKALVDELLAIPCDQRYEKSEISYLISRINGEL